MSLSSLFDDFPILNYDNGGLQRRRRPKPLLYSVLDSLEDQIGQRVGQVFRLLPALTLELEDQYENAGPGKKRKLRSTAVSAYEPKSKVAVTNKDEKFKITLDTSSYQPEEITVKVVNDKIAISAKHEAKEKDVYEFCEMYRSFDLPENVDPNAIISHLSASGQLTIEAPLKAPKETRERAIPIQIEGKEKPAVEENVKSTAVEENVKSTAVDENVKSTAVDENVKSTAVEENVKSAAVEVKSAAVEVKSAAVEENVKSAAVEENVKSAVVEENVKSAAAEENVKSAAAEETSEPPAKEKDSE